MFDVSWGDPGMAETVGQRKQRKEQQQNSARNGLELPPRPDSVKSSRSAKSNGTQFKPSFLNFLGSSQRKAVPKRGDIHAPTAKTAEKLSPSIMSPRKIETAEIDRPLSSYTIDESTTQVAPPESASGGIIRVDLVGSTYHSDPETSPSEITESIFSHRTERSRKTVSTWSSAVESTICPSDHHTVQPLSPKSFVSRSTEVTISPRRSLKRGGEQANFVQISSNAIVPIQIHESTDRSETPTTILEFPMPKALLIQSRPLSNSSTKEWPIPNGSAWQPPEEWNCSSERKKPSIESKLESIDLSPLPLRPRRTNTKVRRMNVPSTEMIQLQRTISKMEAANDNIVLERLKEQWTQIVDACVYRELELEKQLWMLTALRRRPGGEIQRMTKPGTDKILSLFENHASCSSLSAVEPSCQIHHLSTSPLSPISSWPNVFPLVVPGPSCQLPYASESFASIHAFSLPALLPAASLPFMLKECRRTLVSDTPVDPSIGQARAGILHLTILDPTPLPLTLGPRLRDWLDRYLILHLERQFKCINPSRLFPVWLTDAGLRAPGSTIDRIRFLASYTPLSQSPNSTPEFEPSCPASISISSHSSTSTCCPPSTSNSPDHEDSKEGAILKEDSMEPELASVTGRMLWKEMWGPYVKASNWWWEDESILEECERLQTCWEYAIIQAVKED